MAKIFVITSGLKGILNSSLELISRLEGAGHQVVASSPRSIGQAYREYGFSFYQLPEILLRFEEEVPAFKGPLSKLNRLKYKFLNRTERTKKALDQISPKAFEAWITSEKPDLILIDIELHEYIISAYSMKVSFVLLSQWFSTWNRKGLPYLLTDIIPGRGWKGSGLNIKWNWYKIKWKRRFTFAKQNFFSFGTDRRSSLIALAKYKGFPLEFIRENYWPGPFSYDKLPVISMTMRELEFPHDQRPNLHYVGPMVYLKRIHAQDALDDRLNLILKQSIKDSKYLIYGSVSTLSETELEFVKELIQAFKDEKQWTAILSIGEMCNRLNEEDLPENVHLFTQVPQLRVLKQAHLSINHAGIHTIHECIQLKVPMLIYSGQKSDQNGCAARMEFHEVAVSRDKWKDSSSEIKAQINKILTDNKHSSSIHVVHSRMDRYKTGNVLENVVDSLLNKDQLNPKRIVA